MADLVQVVKPGESPCCICGKTSTHIAGTGGGFDYTLCEDHFHRLWKAFDSEDEQAMEFPMCFPAGTWAGTAARWQEAGFRVANVEEIPAWEAHVDQISEVH